MLYIWKLIPTLTSTILTMKLVKVGKALFPTRASASTFKFSNRTSIAGRSIPTLMSWNPRKKNGRRRRHSWVKFDERHTASLMKKKREWESDLSIRSLSLSKNFSLSSSAVLTSLWSKTLLSCNPSLCTSISFTPPSDEVSKAFLIREMVGSFWMVAHLRASSSSSLWNEFENISSPLSLQMDVLPFLKLPPLSIQPDKRTKRNTTLNTAATATT